MHDFGADEPSKVYIAQAEYIEHKDDVGILLAVDLALIRLETPVTFSGTSTL